MISRYGLPAADSLPLDQWLECDRAAVVAARWRRERDSNRWSLSRKGSVSLAESGVPDERGSPQPCPRSEPTRYSVAIRAIQRKRGSEAVPAGLPGTPVCPGGSIFVGLGVWVAAAKVEAAISARIAGDGSGKSFFISLRSRRLTALSRPIIAPLPFLDSAKNSPHHGSIFVRVRSNLVGLSSPASSRSLRCEMINWCGIDRSSLRLLVPYATSTTICPDGLLITRRTRPGRDFGAGFN
jgi:hypothetical protein